MQVLVISSLWLLSLAQLEPERGNQLRGVNSADTQVVTGLKEALAVAALDAIKATGAENGFSSNSSIKIVMPESMKTSELELRRAGNGLKINEFELSMNRAAEMASRGASVIFAKAIGGLSFSDPRSVLNGKSTAATDYFARNSSAQLLQALRPVVEAATNKAGVVENYNTLMIQMKGLTMGQATAIDITAYLTRKTLDGLLFTMSGEEQKIRNDPQAQVVPIIRDVFAKP